MDERVRELRSKIEPYMEMLKEKDDIWDDEDSREYKVKMALRELSDFDRTLFLLYVSIGTLSGLGKALGCSTQMFQKDIARIKEEIRLMTL